MFALVVFEMLLSGAKRAILLPWPEKHETVQTLNEISKLPSAFERHMSLFQAALVPQPDGPSTHWQPHVLTTGLSQQPAPSPAPVA
jgi:hypothetical protein